MTTVVRTVIVPTGAGKVAPYLSDFSTTAEWDPNTASCRRLDPGPLAVGSRFENVQRLAGHDSAFTYTVTQYEPGKRIVLEGRNSTVRTRDEMTFTQTPTGGTSVRYTVDVSLQGLAQLAQPLMPLLLKAIADRAEKGMRKRLLALEQER